MFFREKKKTAAPKPALERRDRHIPSILSADMAVTGDFVSKGALEIEGSVEGNITCDTVAVRKNAEVKGNISANHIFIDGKANGMIKGKNILVSPGASVSGVIYYDTLTVKDGAALNAQCKSLSELLAADGERPASPAEENDESGLFEEMTLPAGKSDAEEDDAARDAAIASLHKDFEDEAETAPKPAANEEAPDYEKRAAVA